MVPVVHQRDVLCAEVIDFGDAAIQHQLRVVVRSALNLQVVLPVVPAQCRSVPWSTGKYRQLRPADAHGRAGLWSGSWRLHLDRW